MTDEAQHLEAQLAAERQRAAVLTEEIEALRHRLLEAPRRVRTLEERLL